MVITSSASSASSVPVSRSKVAIEQAIEALRSGNAPDAEWTLRQRLLEQPDDVLVLSHLGDLLANHGRNLEASLIFKRALGYAPRADNIRLALAHLLQQQGQFGAALKEVEALGDPLRDGFDACTLEAALLGHLGLHDRELAVYEQLVADHELETLWMSYANALKTVGRAKDAVEALRRAIKARPTYGEAYWTLANLKIFRFEDRDIAAMRKALKGELSPSDALHFHFALGKALEEREDTDESFRHYALGNRIRASQLPSAATIITSRVDAAVATFDESLFERFRDCGDKARDPIFIVSLQRSGSTLIEQILASHPMIEGTAELIEMEQIWSRLGGIGSVARNPFVEVAKLDCAALAALGAEYLERTRAFRQTDRPLFVDKLPANWMNVGFIRLILPNARIIDARRHPMACGFSNFRQHYASGVTFSYSLESIGRFYADYLRLMNHFDRLLPGAVHHVINERLIDDPEGEVHKLLDYVGVPFDPACLEFHKTERAVHSASSEQVRRPLNRDGVDYWRRYESWLGPLKEALGDALDTWDRIPA